MMKTEQGVGAKPTPDQMKSDHFGRLAPYFERL
jgi:hypothetical protein